MSLRKIIAIVATIPAALLACSPSAGPEAADEQTSGLAICTNCPKPPPPPIVFGCGGLGQTCCTTTVNTGNGPPLFLHRCNDSSLKCSTSDTCIVNTDPPPACGHVGQTCCPGGLTTPSYCTDSNTECDPTGTCVTPSPPPPCGALGQACCVGLGPVPSLCRAPNSLCQNGSDPYSGTCVPSVGGPAGLVKAYTEHLGKLTDTSTNNIQRLGMNGLDLGISFQSTGGLAFLFGDTWPIDSADWNFDSVALTSATQVRREQMPALDWFTRPDSTSFARFTMPGVSLGGMEVPMEGVAIGARNYVFATSGWDSSRGTDTLLALGHVDGTNLSSVTTDFRVGTSKFVNVSVGVLYDQVYIWGTGNYRASAVYLAKVSKSQLADHNAWSYYRGTNGGFPSFGPGEDTAAPLIPITCGGEISVRLHPATGLWIMTYNCGNPRGINLRTAPSPTGPWSDPIVALDPWDDAAYERFMHVPVSFAGFDDGLTNWALDGSKDPYEQWGGEYGPYMVPSWFWTEAPGVFHVIYTMSSWNPYQVHLMDTVLTTPGTTATRPIRGAGLPKATLVNGDFGTWDTRGWQMDGDGFGVFRGADGTPHVTSYVRGDAAKGRMWQDFAVDSATTTLSFRVHGGASCSVKLIRVASGEVVRVVHGRNTNDPEQPVQWNLEDYRGDTVRLLLEDENVDPWGAASPDS